MALGVLVAGAYTGTWNSVALGLTRTGFTIANTTKAEIINETDGYGLTTIDWIYRGMDVFCQYNCREYKAGPIGAFWPWGGNQMGRVVTAAVPIGSLASGAAKPFVLTVTANTPAAGAPATITGLLSLLAPNFDAQLLYDSRLREVPIRMQFLPYASSTDILCFTQT